MKRFHHICMTAHSEVLLRSVEDVALFVNLSAISALRCETDILTDSEMSTHLHETVLSDSVDNFSWSQQLSLTKAFNHRHSRKGPLFDSKPYILEIRGPRHMQMALNYSLRQGLHHGQSETAFEYPWSTCNSLFAAERGVPIDTPAHKSRAEIQGCLPKNFRNFPDSWQADANGILLRNSFEQLRLVENWYGTARSFIFSMTRRTSEEWLNEQKADNTEGPTVTLDLLEKGFCPEDITAMLSREGNAKFATRCFSDMYLCSLIDNQMLGRFGADSVYLLSASQKQKLAAELKYDIGVRSEAQISRCLAMRYNR